MPDRLDSVGRGTSLLSEWRIVALCGGFILAILCRPAPARAGMAGTLDPGFGTGGKVISDVGSGSQDSAIAVGIATGRKPVVIGTSDANGSKDFAVLRYTKAGALDTKFGVGGKVLTDFGTGSSDFANGGLVEPNGKIVVVGGSNAADSNTDFAIARYNKNGTLDSSFGNGGKVLTDFGAGNQFEDATAVALAAGGKLIVVGGTSTDFAVARYNKNGTLDTSFGTGGLVTTDFGGDTDFAQAVAIQSDGKIVVAGSSNASDPMKRDFAIARYNKNGTLDMKFGNGGKVLTDFGTDSYDVGGAMVLAPNGKIVVGGSSDALDPNFDFALARYNRDGSLDDTFGNGGKVLTPFGMGSDDEMDAIALEPRNKIIAVGSTLAQNPDGDTALARYTGNGSLDPTFGSGGLVITNFGGPSEANAIAIAGSKAVVAGNTSALDPMGDIAVARFLLK